MATVIADPKCQHSTRMIGSVMVSSHKDIMTARGRMCSVRVCTRQKCIDDATRWVREMGFATAWVDGERS